MAPVILNLFKAWFLTARPKTLIALISPVLMGSCLAFLHGSFDILLFFATLLAGLGVQISTNYCNDYFDCVRGADTDKRKGPKRGIHQGLITLKQLKTGTIISFGITALLCCYLVYKGGWILALFSFISLLLAYCYTGGTFSLAYLGISDLFCFAFFGPIASGLTYYLQTHHFHPLAFLAGVAPGALSTAILAVNNIRDIEDDAKVHKKTLPVRLGKQAGEIEYIAMIGIASLVPLAFIKDYPLSILATLIALPGIRIIRTLLKTKQPTEYNKHLQSTAALLFLYTFLFTAGLLL